MSQIKVNFFKVIGLPSEPEPNSYYFVQNGEFADAFLTDADGVPSKCGNVEMINALIAAAAPNTSPIFHLKDFGAVTDGTTDDAPSLQSALEAALDAGGGTIVFPPGITHLSDNGASIDFAGNQGSVVFQGSNGQSIVYLHGVEGYAIEVKQAVNVLFRDLIFIGAQSNSFDVGAAAIRVSSSINAIVDNCLFAGIATNQTPATLYGVGIVLVHSAKLIMRDSMFGGCVSLNGGVVEAQQCNGVSMQNVFFRDYLTVGETQYNKSPLTGASKHWFYGWNPYDWTTANAQPDWKFNNVQMDEGNSDSAIKIIGTSKQNITFDGLTVNSGIVIDIGEPDVRAKAIVINTARKVSIRNSWIGYNTGEWESATFEDVALLEIDNLMQEQGAKYLSLLGTTERATILNSSLQGNEDFPNGVNNEAGAELSFQRAKVFPVTLDEEQEFTGSAVLADTGSKWNLIEGGIYKISGVLQIYIAPGWFNHAFGGTAEFDQFDVQYRSHWTDAASSDYHALRVTDPATLYGPDRYNTTAKNFVCFIDGIFKVSESGTLILKAAQAVSDAGISKLLVSSNVVVERIN